MSPSCRDFRAFNDAVLWLYGLTGLDGSTKYMKPMRATALFSHFRNIENKAGGVFSILPRRNR